MSDSDDDVPLFVVLMDYYLKKIRDSSRVPRQILAFSGWDRVVELLAGHDDVFVDILRMTKDCFLSLCRLLAEQGLQETRSISVQEQVMVFLTVVGHCDSNRQSAYEWRHSGETIRRHFNNVCSHIVKLAPTLIGPPDFGALSPVIAENQNFFPYFEGCVGAMDGTHIPCTVQAHLQVPFRNRKGYTSQNVLAIVNFDMRFTYVVAGWEGSAHDARVLHEAQMNATFMFPHPPIDKYYLVDSGYANRPGYLAPYRGTNYHLFDRRRAGGDRKKEMFNYRHSALRNIVERTFGIWKQRFHILRGIPHYTIQKKRDIIIECAVLHNFIRMSPSDDTMFSNAVLEDEEENNEENE